MAVTRAARSDWLVVGRKMAGIGRAMDLIALAEEAVVVGSRIVFVVCCWEAYPVVVRADFRTMTVLVALEAALRNMIVEACLAYSAGSWAESRVAMWHTACRRNQLHSERLSQKHRP